jgi:cytidylate kinase
LSAVVDTPVVAIDGPTASGKGTVARQVAERLGFHYLDSGALYRMVALAVLRARMEADDEARLHEFVSTLHFDFRPEGAWLDGEYVEEAIREETCGNLASRLSAIPGLRAALLQQQHDFRTPPGLVAEGRDMGSVVFPDACLKIFFTASPEIRAQRRYKQLIEKGMCVSLEAILQELKQRDERDRRRAVSPLQKGPDALLLDTSALSIKQAVVQVLEWFDTACPGKS